MWKARNIQRCRRSGMREGDGWVVNTYSIKNVHIKPKIRNEKVILSSSPSALYRVIKRSNSVGLVHADNLDVCIVSTVQDQKLPRLGAAQREKVQATMYNATTKSKLRRTSKYFVGKIFRQQRCYLWFFYFHPSMMCTAYPQCHAKILQTDLCM